MRLNMECVRDVLLCVEENTGIRKNCCFQDIKPEEYKTQRALGREAEPLDVPDYQVRLLDCYDIDELMFHVLYCAEADLIKCENYSGKKLLSYGRIMVSGLTVSGHELIGNIREKTVWEKLKGAFPRSGEFGLSVLSEAAHSLAVSLILARLNLS